jgi:hypothetical protein
MNERKDEKWLDQQLGRAVDGTTPVFDAESWKRKHQVEYQALLSRGRVSRRIRGIWAAGLAVAAAIAIAVGLFVVARSGHGPARPAAPPADRAAGMMSMMSLRMAYQRGGFDALDRQLQDSLDVFRPRSSSLSMRELLNGISESENRKG